MFSWQREQLLTFFILFTGYGSFVLCRKSFSFVLPLVKEESGLSDAALGAVVSAQNLAYGLSKFVVGVASDDLSPRLLFSAGLVGVGASVVAFSASNSASVFVLCWFLNGLMQGCGWPACAQVLRFWFRADQFGTTWSLLSASMNVIGVVFPLLLPFLLLLLTWRHFMLLAGVVSMSWCFVAGVFLRDTPQEAGLAPIRPDLSTKNPKQARGSRSSGWALLVRSGFVWLISVQYMVVFAARTACENWLQLLLLDGHTEPVSTSEAIGVFELGGFVSSLLTGFLTDYQMARYKGRSGFHMHPRMFVSFIYMLGSAVAIQAVLGHRTTGGLFLWSFILGATLYGNINIFGIVATEAAPADLGGSSHAIVSLAANVGGVLAGFPLTSVAEFFGWPFIFFQLEIACLFCALATFLCRRLTTIASDKHA